MVEFYIQSLTRQVRINLFLGYSSERKLPPRVHAPPMDFHTTYDESQMPEVDDQVIDSEYPVELGVI